jgi:phosphohistidine swiveling domain-containing protein
LKSVAVRYWAALRFIILELGERLAARRVLESRDDIFFLSMDEIDPVRRGEAGFKVREVVAARRAEHERNLVITPPKVVVGRFDPGNFVPDAIEESAELLTGLAVSPGVVTGPARVILRANTNERVLPGEILVTPFTDPGWAPYFLPAAAIVMDQGGLLSHGSIVAREYGIPAVVNVGPATKIIHTGQTIQVDGNSGVVRILR